MTVTSIIRIREHKPCWRWATQPPSAPLSISCPSSIGSCSQIAVSDPRSVWGGRRANPNYYPVPSIFFTNYPNNSI